MNDNLQRLNYESAKSFVLNRKIDESGMSGTGIIAEGVELPNGQCIMWWIKPPHSIQIYLNKEALLWIHGHGEKKTTDFVYISNTQRPIL